MARERPDTMSASVVAAGTVVIARDAPDGVETLMVRRNSAHAFGGMWVFPGGKVERDDGGMDGGVDPIAMARRAAVREAAEEAGVALALDSLVTLAHWLPPVEAPRRFSTWFFLAPAPADAEAIIDGEEIHEHEWVRPADAIERAARGEMRLAVPTWMTLASLRGFGGVAAALEHAAAAAPARFHTRMIADGDVRYAVWVGDAAYVDGDVHAVGPRRRLVMAPTGWRYEGADVTVP